MKTVVLLLPASLMRTLQCKDQCLAPFFGNTSNQAVHHHFIRVGVAKKGQTNQKPSPQCALCVVGSPQSRPSRQHHHWGEHRFFVCREHLLWFPGRHTTPTRGLQKYSRSSPSVVWRLTDRGPPAATFSHCWFFLGRVVSRLAGAEASTSMLALSQCLHTACRSMAREKRTHREREALGGCPDRPQGCHPPVGQQQLAFLVLCFATSWHQLEARSQKAPIGVCKWCSFPNQAIKRP